MGKYNTKKNYSQQLRGKNPYGKSRIIAKMSKPVQAIYSAGKGGPEVHVYDLFTQNSVPNNGAQTVIDLLGLIAQGDDVSNRNGQKICVKSIDVKGMINIVSYPTTGTGNQNTVSVDALLVLDKQSGSSSAAAMFEDSTTNHTPIAKEYLQRFEILNREQYTISTNSTGVTDFGPNGGQIKFHKKMNMPTRYQDGGNPVATNSMYLVFLSSNATASTTVANVSIDSYVRVRFTD